MIPYWYLVFVAILGWLFAFGAAFLLRFALKTGIRAGLLKAAEMCEAQSALLKDKTSAFSRGAKAAFDKAVINARKEAENG